MAFRLCKVVLHVSTSACTSNGLQLPSDAVILSYTCIVFAVLTIMIVVRALCASMMLCHEAAALLDHAYLNFQMLHLTCTSPMMACAINVWQIIGPELHCASWYTAHRHNLKPII